MSYENIILGTELLAFLCVVGLGIMAVVVDKKVECDWVEPVMFWLVMTPCLCMAFALGLTCLLMLGEYKP